MSQPARPTIQHTESAPKSPGPIAPEGAVSRWEAGRMPAEGHEGGWVLIKGGGEIVGVYPTHEDAVSAGIAEFADASFLVREIPTPEPLVRIPPSCWPGHVPPLASGAWAQAAVADAPPQPARPTVHYTELGPMLPGSRIAREWDVYRREVGRLLAEGHEGQFVLIQGDEILGIYPTHDEAARAGYAKFVVVPFLVQQILTEEPTVRISPYCLPCRT